MRVLVITLRQRLGGDAAAPRYIATKPGLVAAPSWGNDAEMSDAGQLRNACPLLAESGRSSLGLLGYLECVVHLDP
jgi:hypothetical protein